MTLAVKVALNPNTTNQPTVPYNPEFNSLSNDKILDVTKLKAFADDKISVAQMIISVFDRLENIVGKGENAGYQHFLFTQCFQKASFLGSLKVGKSVVKI